MSTKRRLTHHEQLRGLRQIVRVSANHPLCSFATNETLRVVLSTMDELARRKYDPAKLLPMKRKRGGPQ